MPPKHIIFSAILTLCWEIGIKILEWYLIYRLFKWQNWL